MNKNKPLDHQFQLPAQQWEQQRQPQHEGVVIFDRSRAANLARVVEQAYNQPVEISGEPREAIEISEDSLEITLDMDDVRGRRSTALQEVA